MILKFLIRSIKKCQIYIRKLNVSIEEAKKIQKSYFHEYNTTLNGMIKNHEIDANEFLEFVHDVNLDFLKANKPLEQEITNLNGKNLYLPTDLKLMWPM